MDFNDKVNRNERWILIPNAVNRSDFSDVEFGRGQMEVGVQRNNGPSGKEITPHPRVLARGG